MKKITHILLFPFRWFDENFNHHFENETRPPFLPQFAWAGKSGLILFIALVIGYAIAITIAVFLCRLWWDSPYIDIPVRSK